MYTVVAAGMNRQVNIHGKELTSINVYNPQVIAVDADPRNLAYLRTSLDLNNSTRNARIVYNAVRFDGPTSVQSYNIEINISSTKTR